MCVCCQRSVSTDTVDLLQGRLDWMWIVGGLADLRHRPCNAGSTSALRDRHSPTQKLAAILFNFSSFSDYSFHRVIITHPG